MRITILRVAEHQDIDENMLVAIAAYNQSKELLCQFTTNINATTIDPNKVSHVAKEIRYNPITQTLDCTVECLSTPYGDQLKILLDKYPERIKFAPVYLYDNGNLELHTVNACIGRTLHEI